MNIKNEKNDSTNIQVVQQTKDIGGVLKIVELNMEGMRRDKDGYLLRLMKAG